MHRLIPAIFGSAIFILALPACQQPGAGAKSNAQACTKPGQQCHLKAGGLGVCTRAADQTRFECVSQH